MIIRFLAVFLFASLCACSSVKSIESPDESAAQGLGYYMPKKDFVVSFSIENDKIKDVTLGTTPAYPDYSKQYVLKYGRNYFGQNVMNIGVTENGLLSSATSETKSSTAEVIKGLVSSATQLDAFEKSKPFAGEKKQPAGQAKCKDGKYRFVFSGEGAKKPCQYNLLIDKQDLNGNIIAPKMESGKAQSGIYYRQNEPYLLTFDAEGRVYEKMVFSPSASSTFFLPIAKSAFSNNKAAFEFKDGVPVKYDQDTGGELVSLIKLPADMIGAYFAAIGNVFTGFKDNSEKEQAALSASLSLELQRKKYEACMDAIDAGDADLIDELGC